MKQNNLIFYKMNKDNTQLQSVLYEQLQHGLFAQINKNSYPKRSEIEKIEWTHLGYSTQFYTILPILHEMDLTKPITVEGETFVPIERLKKIFYNVDWQYISFGNGFEVEISMDSNSGIYFNLSFGEMTGIIECFKKWHMNYLNLPESYYIKVSSLPKYPYA